MTRPPTRTNRTTFTMSEITDKILISEFNSLGMENFKIKSSIQKKEKRWENIGVYYKIFYMFYRTFERLETPTKKNPEAVCLVIIFTSETKSWARNTKFRSTRLTVMEVNTLSFSQVNSIK